MELSKCDMLTLLPRRAGEYAIRQWRRDDMDELAQWPSYPFPYEAFNFSFRGMSSDELDELFRTREEKPNMIVLVVDHVRQPAMGYFAPQQIDWAARRIGNFGFRIHPSWCNKGVGTLVLREFTRWCLDCGQKVICLDVAASNARAIRCYEKVGFVRTGEIWRQAADLRGADLTDPRYDFLRPHVRVNEGSVRLRFWLMELRNEARGVGPT